MLYKIRSSNWKVRESWQLQYYFKQLGIKFLDTKFKKYSKKISGVQKLSKSWLL